METQDIENILRQNLPIKSIDWKKFGQSNRAIITVESVDGHPGIRITHDFHDDDDYVRILDLVKNTFAPNIAHHIDNIRAVLQSQQANNEQS